MAELKPLPFADDRSVMNFGFGMGVLVVGHWTQKLLGWRAHVPAIR